MSEAKPAGKVGRPSRTLEEEIIAAEEKLRALKEKKRLDEKRERERNQQAIIALVRTEGLDNVPADVWKSVLPQLRKLLKAESNAAPKVPATTPEDSDSTHPAAVAG